MDVQPTDLDFDRCAGCPLAGARFVPADGAGNDYSVFVVGTAPGENDERAFTGTTGRILRSILDDLGLRPFYTNVLKRKPPAQATRDQCWRCGLHLIEEMKRNRVTVILAAGAVPFKFLYGMNDMSLPEVHGLPMQIERFGIDFVLVPTFDPGYVLRNGGIHSKVGDMWLSDIEDFVREVERHGG